MEEHRFGKSSSEERAQTVKNALPEKTGIATDFWVGIFERYCSERHGLNFNFASGSADELASLLAGYYAEIRKKDGTEYKLRPTSPTDLLVAVIPEKSGFY